MGPFGPCIVGRVSLLRPRHTQASYVVSITLIFNRARIRPMRTITTGHRRAASRPSKVIPPPVLVPQAPKRSTISRTDRLVADNRSHSTLLTRPTDSPPRAEPTAAQLMQARASAPSGRPHVPLARHTQRAHAMCADKARAAPAAAPSAASTTSAREMGCCSTELTLNIAGSLWTRSDLTALWRAHFHNFKHDDLSRSLRMYQAPCARGISSLSAESQCAVPARASLLSSSSFSPLFWCSHVVSRRSPPVKRHCRAQASCASPERTTRAIT